MRARRSTGRVFAALAGGLPALVWIAGGLPALVWIEGGLPALVSIAALSGAAGCSDAEVAPAEKRYDVEALVDPKGCEKCHEDHYRDWAGSMHAYAAEDPLFLAMNRRGQRETNGALGDFCVKCHAPMAVRTGATKDGLDLDSVAQELKGVTCFFCHTVEAVEGTHDNPLRLAGDGVLRGPFADPVANDAHASTYSALHDRDQLASAQLCGACHDIVTPNGAALERTFEEWKGTVFAHPDTGATCGQCHMPQSTHPTPIAKSPGVFSRRYHDHRLPGVDLALQPFARADDQKAAVQAFLDTTLQSALCVSPSAGRIHVIVDNVAAGHSWPSGSAQDRRAWIELVAWSGEQIVYQSGVVADGESVVSLPDPDLWLLRDCIFDAAKKPVSMFWEAFSVESHTLPGQVTFDPLDPRYYQTHVYRAFPKKGSLDATPDKVTMRVRLVPVGLDVLDDLVDSGDLDPEVRAKMGVFDIGEAPVVVWTPDSGKQGYVDGAFPYTCVTNTNLAYQADKVPAVEPVLCKP